MSPELDFRIDYLSDFSNLVMILSGIDSKPRPWKMDFDIGDTTLKNLKKIDREEYKAAEKRRRLGEDFEDWMESCDDYDFWPILEWLNSRYEVYWMDRMDELETLRDEKEKFWNQKFSGFFGTVEEVTGLEWSKPKYVNIVSDTMFKGGCWDSFGRPVVYTGAYADRKMYSYVLPNELLHLLIEGDAIPDGFFGSEGVPDTITHDVVESLIGLLLSEVSDMSFKDCLQYLTHAPDRRWLLVKQIIRNFEGGRDLMEMARDIRDSFDPELLKKYGKMCEMEDTTSIND